MSIPAQTWVHEHTSPKHEYMSIPAQTWVHEIVRNSKDVSILYEITGDWWQRYYMILHRIQLNWLHEQTRTNMGAWAYKPKHEYLSIPAQHEYMSIPAQHEYMSIPAQTWVHEIVGNSKDVSILYEITGDCWERYYMILHRIQLYWLHEHTSPNMSTWDCREQ